MSMPIAFQGEVMLLGWKETHNGGAQVAFLLSDPDELEAFKRMTVTKGKVAGQRLACVLIEVDDETMPPVKTADSGPAAEEGFQEPGEGEVKSRTEWDTPDGIIPYDLRNGPQGRPYTRPPNHLARQLHVDGYFRNPKLWAAMENSGIYTQIQHKAWIESLPCIFNEHLGLQAIELPLHRIGLDGNIPINCDGDVVLHHCNSAAIPAAGHSTDTPRKPPHWYGVPLCAINHHQNWAHASHGASRHKKERLLEHGVALTAHQMKAHMKRYLGLESLAQITPEMLQTFEEAIGL